MEVKFPKLKDKDLEFLTEAVNNNELLFSHKLDGTACIMEITPEGVKLTGRGILKSGEQQDYTQKFPDISIQPDYQNQGVSCTLLGEIVVFDENGEDRFDLLQPRTTRKKNIGKFALNFPAKFVAFDILKLNGRNLEQFAQYYRSTVLEIACEEIGIPTALQAQTSETKQHMINTMLEQEWEGIVIKDRVGFYGEKSYKYKQTFTEDVFTEGEYVEGKGRNEGRVGSLICYQYINGIKTPIANVRGFTDEECNQFTHNIKSGIITEENPLILEVKSYKRIMPSLKLRHPSFLRTRTDKAAEQCVYNTEE